MADNKQKQTTVIAARRAKVQEYLLARMSLGDMAALLDVSVGTISGDVKALKKQWAEKRSDLDAMFTQSAMDQDALQTLIMQLMDRVAAEYTPAFISRLLTLMDQRNKLYDLYPKQGTKADQDIPQGPINLQIEIIQPGNRKLVTDDDDEADQQGEDSPLLEEIDEAFDEL